MLPKQEAKGICVSPWKRQTQKTLIRPTLKTKQRLPEKQPARNGTVRVKKVGSLHSDLFANNSPHLPLNFQDL